MTSGFEMNGMILTQCRSPPVRLRPAPKVALSSPPTHGFQMSLGRGEPQEKARPKPVGPPPTCTPLWYLYRKAVTRIGSEVPEEGGT